MSEVSTFRLYLLRAMYVFVAVGSAIFKLAPTIRHPENLSPQDSVIVSVLGGFAILAVMGIRYPLKMLPPFLRVRVEVHLGCGFWAAPIGFRWSGSERKLRGYRNSCYLPPGRRVGPDRCALRLRLRTIFEGARSSVGKSGDRRTAAPER